MVAASSPFAHPRSLLSANGSRWIFGFFAAVCLLAYPARAQTFTAADSGWVPLFNGTDWTGIYGRDWGNPGTITHPPGSPWQLLYTGTDTATIRVTATSPDGNIGTDKTSYSHYRVRVWQKFDQLAGGNNSGMTFHTDESVIRMSNNWPRSIEFQMQQQDAGGAYSIQQVTFTTRVNGNNYAPTGGTTVQACEHGCNARNYSATPLISNGSNGQTRWLKYELVTRGSDTAYYFINDTLVFKLWNIRIFNDQQNGTPDGPYDHGAIGLQSEGAVINFRHWEIMELPPSTPETANFLHRLFLDHPDSGETLKAQAVYAIKWRSLGTADFSKVNLEYNTGTGWETIADSVPNTGSYNWTVPNEPTQTLRLRISGPTWVWADSSAGINTIQPATGILSPSLHPISFMVQGKGEIFANVASFQRLDILNVFGQRVRTFSIGSKNLFWDLTDRNGHRVSPGIYFTQLRASGLTRTARLLVF